jgi:hypothetical protein
MDAPEIFKIIDELAFARTGKHLDTLQLGILKTVFNGQKYSTIAEEYNCTEGHARDKAYELWRILSEVLGENLNKSNVRAAIERLIITNSNNNLVNSVQIDSVNLCPSSNQPLESTEIHNPDDIEYKLKQAKLETAPRLIKLGLTKEQIAQALDLPLALILDKLQ